jgi:hypothetical protein
MKVWACELVLPPQAALATARREKTFTSRLAMPSSYQSSLAGDMLVLHGQELQ